METGHSVLKLSCYSTPPALFDTLAQVFEVSDNNGSRWVSFETTGGVSLTFFAADSPAEAQA
jgi:hypothetical protein